LELALEATRRPGLRSSYDEMGLGIRIETARMLAASGSADPERDAWTLIAWMEGTVFYALAGAGATAAPARDVLRAQLAGLLASMIPVAHPDPGGASGGGLDVGGRAADGGLERAADGGLEEGGGA
jgi:Tetracyclin repressor-like, C-terminal domain